MDTEKYLILEKKIEQGLSPTDEGPFYHHSWWEAYKGSIKGKLGGTVIGMVMGAIVGAAVASLLALIPAVSAATIGIAFAGITGAGILYGAYEFSEIGKIVGAQSAGLEQADAREAIRYAALEQKIDKLTAAVRRSQDNDRSATSDAARILDKPAEDHTDELETYRTTHYAQLTPDKKNRYMFGKVALIGLLVGVVTGALLAIGGAESAAGHLFIDKLALKGLEGAALTAVSAITFGMFGASFGINRDVFRRIFDKTDLWTKGIVSHKKVKEQQIAAGQGIIEEELTKHKKKEDILPVRQEAYSVSYPESDTYYQDKILAAAEKALLSFDHTRATPH